MDNYKRCPECGERFTNVFDAIRHLADANEEEMFDPALILPGGYRLMVGTMLEDIYLLASSGETDKLKKLAESAFLTLYTAENQVDLIAEAFNNMEVQREMRNFDRKLEKFLDDAQEDRG